MMRTIPPFLAAGVLLVAPATLSADLEQVSDGFDYTAKHIHFQRGGDGWNNTSWQDEDRDVQPASDGASLAFPEGVARKSAGARIASGAGEATRALGSGNSVSLLDAVAPRAYFLSFLLRKDDAGAVTLQLNNDADQPRWVITVDEQERASVRIFGDAARTAAGAVPVGDTVFVVSRMVTAPAGEKDTVQLKLYGPGETVPASPPEAWDLTQQSLTNVWQQVVELSIGSGFVEIDELRIGTDWDSVVGE